MSDGRRHIEADAKIGIGKMADGVRRRCRVLSVKKEDGGIYSGEPLHRHELARVGIPPADLASLCARVAISVFLLDDILARQTFQ